MTDDALSGLGRAPLAVLAREYLLAGHLLDRATMPQILARADRPTMTRLAIEEWAAASPIYTRRMQAALNFRGDDVATIFKGLQLDVGAPHQFLDFRFALLDDGTGEFWLDHCGALMDVEPMGEEFVVAMCHDIEDPTFDATAGATNPRARVRPIHRPPRMPVDRTPHCRWRVFIDDDAAPLSMTAGCDRLQQSRAATVTLPRHRPQNGDTGLADYAGPFDPDFEFEKLSAAALRTLMAEVALQGHLLVRAALLALSDQFGEDEAVTIARQQVRGIGPVVAGRLRSALGATDDLDGLGEVLRLHPGLRPHAYTGITVSADDGLRVAIDATAAGLDEGDRLTWPAQLVDEPALLGIIAQGADPRATATTVLPGPGEAAAWAVTLDPSAEPAAPPHEVALVRFSTGADFPLRQRLPVVD